MTAVTKPVQAFDEAELANLLLCMCPESWQDQYNLTQDLLPQFIRKLLGIFENIEKEVGNSNAKEKAAKENSEKATGKRKKGKCKGSSSKDYHIPKKVRIKKSCMLCQKHGDVHTTRNTHECHKYEKDGTIKESFNTKAAIGPKCNGYSKKESAYSFAQFMERFLKLKKAVKKNRKARERRNVARNTATIVIPTQNRIMGMVVL